MGDYREHGYMGKGLIPTLKKYATDIDVLITEGTMLKREDKCIHEHIVSYKTQNVMKTFKYIFVLASATDIERLAAIKQASIDAAKPLCIWSLFMKKTMVVGTSQMDRIKGLLDKLPQEETLLIYSSWDGYYKNPEQVKVNPTYKQFRDMFYNVVDIHTSGHADRQTIEKVIKTVNPKEVICIHKEADAVL